MIAQTARTQKVSQRLSLIAILMVCVLAIASTYAPQPAHAAPAPVLQPTSAIAPQIAPAPQAGTDYSFAGDTIRVEGVTAGTPSYNAATKTLTLNSVKMTQINLVNCKGLTIKLVGASTATGRFILDQTSCNVTITGAGSMTGGAIDNVKNLTIKSGKVTAKARAKDYSDTAVFCTGSLTMSGGTLVATADIANYAYAINCFGKYTQTGGSVTATAKSPYSSTAINCQGGNMKVSGGTMKITAHGTTDARGISCLGDMSASGGSITLSVGQDTEGYSAVGIYAAGKTNIAGTSITVTAESGVPKALDYGINSNGGITMTKGAVKLAKCALYTDVGLSLSGGTVSVKSFKNQYAPAVFSQGAMNVTGGKLSVKNCTGTGVYCKSLSLKKGSILVDGQRGGYGVDVFAKNLVMKSGKLKVTNSYKTAVHAGGTWKNSKPQNGKVKIAGGTFVAKVRKPSDTVHAIEANVVSNKKLLTTKTVKGGITAKGARFATGGSTFTTMGIDNVKLAKYGGKNTRLVLNKVKFAGKKYAIEGVGSKALGTKAGAKVTSIVFKNQVLGLDANAFVGAKKLKQVKFEMALYDIGANAFAGTKSLTSIDFYSTGLDPFYAVFDSKGNFKSLKWSSNAKVSKKAFAKCGKDGGKSLTVTFGGYGCLPGKELKAYKKLLVAKGMPKSFDIPVVY